jgi:hypothetical protein
VHVRYVCIASFIMSYLIYAQHFIWGTFLFYPHIFSRFLQKHSQIFFCGWQLKHVGRLLFCLDISKPLHEDRFGFTLHFLFHKHVFVVFFSVSFFNKKKKIWGEDAELYFFLLIAFQILHVFLPNISVHCALIKYAYIWLRVYAWNLLSFPVAS